MMRGRAGTPRPLGGGFTLVEILVVMSMLSVIMLALGAAMRTIARTEERIDVRLERSDEFRTAAAFMRDTLGRVSVRKTSAIQKAGSRAYLFAPEPQSVAWIGIMPARYGAGGRYFFRLGIESAEGGQALVIRFAPWTDTPAFPNWSQAEARVLVNQVTGFSIRYEDDLPNPAVWQSAWTDVERLPGRLELTLQTTTDNWPPLVFPLRALLAARYNEGGFVVGGSAR